MGTPGAYLLALLYRIFGVSYGTLHLFGYLMAAGALTAALFAARRMFGARTAIFTAVLYIVPTRQILAWSHDARPDYALAFIAAPLVLYFTWRILLQDAPDRSTFFTAALLGLFGGVMLWNNLLLAPALLVSFAFLFARFASRRGLPVLAAFLFFSLIGFLPEIIANFKMDFFLFKMQGADPPGTLPHKIHDFFTNALPYFFGWEDPGSRSCACAIFLAWFFTLAILFVYRPLWKGETRGIRTASGLVAGWAIVHLFAALYSHFGRRFARLDYPTAYIQVLVPAAFIVPAAALAKSRLSKRTQWLLFLPALLMLYHNHQANLPGIRWFLHVWKHEERPWFPEYPLESGPVADWIRENGLRGGYVGGPRINLVRFPHIGRIDFANPFEEVYPRYAYRVDALEKIFWGGRLRPGMEDGLEAAGIDFRKNTLPGYLEKTLFDFRKNPPVPGETLDDFECESSILPLNLVFLKDRCITSGWSTIRAALPGDALTVRLRRPEALDRIVLVPKNHAALPQSFRLCVSPDGKKWIEAAAFDPAPGPLFFSMFHPVCKSVKPRLELDLNRFERVRLLKIEITGESPRPLSLQEIYLYRRSSSPPTPSEYRRDVLAVLDEALKLPPKTLMCGDHWFMSRLYLEGGFAEFLPNRFVDDYGTENPHLFERLSLDRDGRPLALIVFAPHVPETRHMLEKHGLSFQATPFGAFTLFRAAYAPALSKLYWDGLALLHLDYDNSPYPPLATLFERVNETDLGFGNAFRLHAWHFKRRHNTLRFHFEASLENPVSKPYYLFMHFTAPGGTILFQGDFRMAGLRGDTESWLIGERVLLERMVEIPPSVRGPVAVKIGIWNPEEGANLEVEGSPDGRVELTRLDLE